MKLKNLMQVSRPEVTLMLTGIKSDGTEIGYDFAEKKWMDNDLFIPGRVITVQDLTAKRFYRSIADKRIETFSIFKGNSVPALKEVEFWEGKVLRIKIFIDPGKSDIQRAIEAKIDKIARKHLPTRKPKPQTYRKSYHKKKNWSYAKHAPVIEGEKSKLS